MRRIFILVFLGIACLFFNINILSSQVSRKDSLLLVALYDSTHGDSWYNRTNWLTSQPISDWYGITVTDTSVTGISLNRNNLYNKIPLSIQDFKNLNDLELGGNYFPGPIPSAITNLTNLKTLILSGDSLTGSIPASLGQLKNLTRLYLSNNRLSGSIPASFGNLSNLNICDLSINRFNTNIPSLFGNLTNLVNLNLSGDQFNGNIPAALGNLTGLTDLDLFHNQLSGAIPAEFNNLTQLRNFYLSQNMLSGNIPPLDNLYNLSFLDISFNQLTGGLLSLSNLTGLRTLFLSNNKFSGNLPHLTKLTILEELDLSYNQFSGNIGSSLDSLVSLYRLNLDYNNLSGNISPSLGENLTRLLYLYISNNHLTGEIPTSIGNITGLTQLDLSNNLLTDTIPTSITTLMRLSPLIIDSNKFTFESLEKTLLGIAGVLYSPQANIKLHFNNVTLSVSAGGTLSNNTYNWYKNGQLYKTVAGDSTLAITEAGKYYVAVTNRIATDLTLYSDTINFNVLAINNLVFNVINQNHQNLLEWSTAGEMNTNYFNIERSIDGVHFNTIGTSPALEKLGNNSYYFTDKLVDLSRQSSSVYYRLKIVGKDGNFYYGEVIRVKLNDNLFSMLYPNPAKQSIMLMSNIAGKYSIALSAISGKILQIKTGIAIQGINNIEFDISNYAAGIYLVTINNEKNKTQTLRFTKQ